MVGHTLRVFGSGDISGTTFLTPENACQVCLWVCLKQSAQQRCWGLPWTNWSTRKNYPEMFFLASTKLCHRWLFAAVALSFPGAPATLGSPHLFDGQWGHSPVSSELFFPNAGPFSLVVPFPSVECGGPSIISHVTDSLGSSCLSLWHLVWVLFCLPCT